MEQYLIPFQSESVVSKDFEEKLFNDVIVQDLPRTQINKRAQAMISRLWERWKRQMNDLEKIEFQNRANRLADKYDFRRPFPEPTEKIEPETA